MGPLRVQAAAGSFSPSSITPSADSGKLECTRLRSDVRDRVQGAIEALQYEVTPGDVAAKAGVTLAEAEEALTALAADSLSTLKVSLDGDLA